MNVKTKNIYEPAQAGDGFRVLIMRLWPRGVKKEKIDYWEKELGTPPELIKKWKSGSINWSEFSRQYLEFAAAHKDKIAELASRAKKETITLLCSCHDSKHCHRELLRQMLISSAKKKNRRIAIFAGYIF
jgi:uncharacterized protein YeaO (DUF488 family)